MTLWALLIPLLFLHGPGGQEIRVNPRTITNLRDVPKRSHGHFPAGTHCLVFLTDGKFITVVETCPEVAAMMRTP